MSDEAALEAASTALHEGAGARELPARFSAYVAGLLAKRPKERVPRYPGLSAAPWHDPSRFPMVAALEAAFPQIRNEVLGVTQLQLETESISRTGTWEVAFFHECGLKHPKTRSQCPTLTGIIDTFPTIRTIAGLAYISRLAPSTAIQPHCANSPIRLRCHLAIKVPDGDCGICVGGLTRTWQEGKCLVFDDYFEHHAWNHTADERVCVIIDVWHPDLEPEEIESLTRLHNYIEKEAIWLSRYRAGNARARLQADERRGT